MESGFYAFSVQSYKLSAKNSVIFLPKKRIRHCLFFSFFAPFQTKCPCRFTREAAA